MTQKWLSIVGIAEDMAGLSPIARSLVDRAEILVGGDRHLALLPPDDPRPTLKWTNPIADSIDEIVRRRGQAVCVLASGDPMCYGIGVTLLRQMAIEEMTIVPAPSSFSLACARLGWSLAETETLSLCARPPALLQSYLYPGAKLLILSEGKHTPQAVAQLLIDRGFGRSKIIVLEQMGSSQERLVRGAANAWTEPAADLNTIALDCIADADVMPLPRLAGLPDQAYRHDGQLTKREVRAMTLAALVPLPGELLWDVGAGCGSIGIEWMRTDRRCRAIAIESHPDRLGYIADNALALGTPNLRIVAGEAPVALQDLPSPHAIFIGGGAASAGLFEACWDRLRSGGRLVANVVTLAGEQQLLQWHDQWGGELTRIAVQRVGAIGSFPAWKPMAPVTQWAITKP